MKPLTLIVVAALVWAAGCQSVDDAVSNDPLLGSKSGQLPSEMSRSAGR